MEQFPTKHQELAVVLQVRFLERWDQVFARPLVWPMETPLICWFGMSLWLGRVACNLIAYVECFCSLSCAGLQVGMRIVGKMLHLGIETAKLLES